MAEVLAPDALRDALAGLPGWHGDTTAITREYRRPGGFSGSVAFVALIAPAADAADHHPDVDIRWDRVTVTLTTHSAGGVTAKDLHLAAVIDGIAAAA